MDRRTVARALTGALAAPTALAGCAVRVRPPQAREPARPGEEPARSGEVPRIDVDAAYAEVRAGRAVLVDVRTTAAYRTRRAAGAISLPLDQLEAAPAAAAALPTGQRPILYCT
jgi:hypothetical protein